ncbi:MAG: hypothetical protein V4759_03865 [Pseudomonadota bacterium]
MAHFAGDYLRMAAEAFSDPSFRWLSLGLDADFYREAHPDLSGGQVEPVAHYGFDGWREGRDPAAWFSTQDYLALNPDVAASGQNPFVHYLMQGRREGRTIVRSRRADAWLRDRKLAREGRLPEQLGPAQFAAAAVEFDAAFYLGQNPDVAAGGGDPLEHFLFVGWREGRDPNTTFSVRDYLELNPDVAAAGVQPFLHYLGHGRAEGRLAKRDLGFRHDIIARMLPLRQRLEDFEYWARQIEPGAAEALAAGLAESRTGLADLHITFSHDNYAATVGGLQLCIQREAADIATLGRDHLHLYPAHGWPMVRTGQGEVPLGVMLNGVPLGFYEQPIVLAELKAAFAKVKPGARSFAIHSMLGHSARDVVDVVRTGGLNAGYFWIHDFTALCAGVHLLRNDVEDCGAPPPGSPACSVCVYAPGRALHISEHERLFSYLDLTVVAPSQNALDTWRRGGLDARDEIVVPHARLIPTRARPKPRKPGPFRFAFPGGASAHKGWPIFRDLALRFAGDPRYEFVHLAAKTSGGLPISHHPVSVTAEKPLAMRDTIRHLDIDAAMVWSICRETFSFTAYEAVAAGAAVVTSPDSGNVQAFTRQDEHGLVLADEAALIAAFESGDILRLSREVRSPVIQDLGFSALTADLLRANA